MEKMKQMLQYADKTKSNAYAPYSKYKVGATVLSDKGNMYAACNVENISFPCGTCAEAGAISAMIAAGERKIKAILITSGGSDLVYPCGACLQRIAEFGTKDTLIYLADDKEVLKTYRLEDLLPYNFNTKDLSHD